MSVIVLLVRLALAAVFAVASAAKLTAHDATRKTLGEFGVPERLTSPVAWLLPIAEAAIAVALLVTPTARAGGAAAAGLLLVFAGAVGVNLARGRRPDCNCFGAVHSAPIGPSTLARNLVLAGAATFVAVFGPGASAFAWLGRLSPADLALTVAVVALGAGLLAVATLALALFRRHGELLLRVEALESTAPGPAPEQPGLPVGAPAPEFTLHGLDGETMTLAALRSHGRPVLLLFTDPECGPCNALLPELGGWQRDYERALTIAVVSRRSAEANRPKAKEHGLVNVLLQAENEAAEAFAATATPAAVLVAADGAIASAAAFGADAIRSLVRAAGVRPAALGDEAPEFLLRDLVGSDRALSEFRGRELVLLFWNPGCSFCAAMSEDLRGLDVSVERVDSAELLVLTTGEGVPPLRSTVLLDPGGAVAAQFGASGTPMAVRVDAGGFVSSPVAVGAEQVLALAAPLSPALAPES